MDHHGSALATGRASKVAASSWRSRARVAVRLLLLAQILGFAFMVAGTHGAFGPQPVPPTTTDFASFYAAGLLADRDTAAVAYDAIAHRAAEFEAVAAGVAEKRFINPPVFLLICAPLARLPYLVAFVLFEGTTCILWLVLSTRIAGGGAPAAVALAAIPSVWWALGWGQNTFLSAGLFAAGTMLVRQRPWLAGAAFGALCFKPHLALLVPVALVAGCHWQALISAALSASAWCTLSIVCFGLSTWRAFIATLLERPLVEIGTGLTGHVDLASAARLLGAPSSIACTIHGVAAMVSAIVVAQLWRRARIPDARDATPEWQASAGLIAGTLVAAPFLLFYDLVIAGVAAAWIARNARRHDEAQGVAVAFALLTGLDLLAFPAATTLHIAVGALIPPIVLSLALRTIIRRAT